MSGTRPAIDLAATGKAVRATNLVPDRSSRNREGSSTAKEADRAANLLDFLRHMEPDMVPIGACCAPRNSKNQVGP